MTDRRYVRITYPWDATIDVTTPQPALFFGQLLQQTIRFGNPGLRRFGWLRAAFARRDLPPAGAIAWAVSKKRPAASALDGIAGELAASWTALKDRGAALPGDPEGISFLELARAAARTVFVFGGEPRPLLVLKIPGDEKRIDREAEALEKVVAAEVAPRYLGRVGTARVQEGLLGRPLRLEPFNTNTAATEAHASLATGLERLAGATASSVQPEELDAARLRAAIDSVGLPAGASNVARAATDDISGLGASVIKHGDTSAQNCMFHDGVLTGLVDWETARMHGAPGFDTWNASLALFEHGMGLRRSSEHALRSAFRGAWSNSPYFAFWRAAARRNAVAAGVDEGKLDALEVAFFARRLEHRLAEPTAFATGPETARHMLETVCASS